MSYALRHHPEKYGLKLDDYGFVDLHTFLRAMNHVHHFHPALTEEAIRGIMARADKQRFAIEPVGSDHHLMIGALYGHSFVGNVHGHVKREIATPPSVLYHGTARRFVPSILREGLLPESRQFVHLSTDVQMATQVGRRHDPHPVILRIDAARAHADGITFYRGNSRVWLVEKLPSRYITEDEASTQKGWISKI